jgi:hypothetical protein
LDRATTMVSSQMEYCTSTTPTRSNPTKSWLEGKECASPRPLLDAWPSSMSCVEDQRILRGMKKHIKPIVKENNNSMHICNR